MRLGAYTACLHDTPLPETLRILAGLGLDSAEINSGGFLPPVHLPVEDLRSSATARTEYLDLFDEAGVADLGSHLVDLSEQLCGPLTSRSTSPTRQGRSSTRSLAWTGFRPRPASPTACATSESRRPSCKP